MLLAQGYILNIMLRIVVNVLLSSLQFDLYVKFLTQK